MIHALMIHVHGYLIHSDKVHGGVIGGRGPRGRLLLDSMIHRAVVHCRVIFGRLLHDRMIHALMIHDAVIHAPHAHVLHRQGWARAPWGYRCTHAFLCCQRGGGVTRAVVGLAHDGESLIGVGLHDHVEGLRRSNLKFVGGDRFDIHTVSGHHCHRQAGDAHIENTHGRGINKSQPYFFTWLKQGCPIFLRTVAVD